MFRVQSRLLFVLVVNPDAVSPPQFDEKLETANGNRSPYYFFFRNYGLLVRMKAKRGDYDATTAIAWDDRWLLTIEGVRWLL